MPLNKSMTMKPFQRFISVSLLFSLLALPSCNDADDTQAVTAYFQKAKCGSSPDCAILLQSTVDPSSWDHVITVHGFVNDDEMAEKLTEYLNSSTHSKYRVMLLNN